MKKIFLLFVLALGGTLYTHGQVIEDFETWNPYTVSGVALTEPINWSCSDSFIVAIGSSFNPTGTYQAQLFKDNPGQAGTGAMRIATKFQDAITAAGIPAKMYPCIATNSQIVLDAVNSTFTQVGGTHVTHRSFTTSMYVKNRIMGGDSTFINVLLIDDSDGADSIIAIADTILTTDISSFTKMTLPFKYRPNSDQFVATTVRYSFASGNPNSLLDTNGTFSLHDSTEIIVDNIEVDMPNGVRQIINLAPIANVYPTHGVTILYVEFLKEMQHMQLEIYGSNGQMILSKNLNIIASQVDLSSLPSGTYIYTLNSKNVILQTGKLVK